MLENWKLTVNSVECIVCLCHGHGKPQLLTLAEVNPCGLETRLSSVYWRAPTRISSSQDEELQVLFRSAIQRCQSCLRYPSQKDCNCVLRDRNDLTLRQDAYAMIVCRQQVRGARPQHVVIRGRRTAIWESGRRRQYGSSLAYYQIHCETASGPAQQSSCTSITVTKSSVSSAQALHTTHRDSKQSAGSSFRASRSCM